MSRRNRQQLIEVDIETFSKKGNGIGHFTRSDGSEWPVEVPFTIPGDKVQALLLRKKSGIYRSLLENIIKGSSDRIQPLCQHFSVCGGCRWQQISYDEQLKQKEKIVRHCFRDLLSDTVDFRNIIPCENPWNYRNKMEFSFSSDKENHQYLGMIMDSSRGKVFNLTECHLPNPWFAEAAQAVRVFWKKSGLEAYYGPKDRGSLRTLTLREGLRTGDRMVNLTVSGNPEYAPKKHHIDDFVRTLREAIELDDPDKHLSIFLTIQQIKKGQPTQFYEMHLYGEDHIREILHIKENHPLTFKISPAAFFQPNTAQAEQLYSHALTMTLIPPHGVVYDLYCGTGTLGICAAKRAKQVIGIELSPEAAYDARQNAKDNGVDNVTILTGAVHDKLREIRISGEYPLPDLVMVDPPRAGLGAEALKLLIKLDAPRILYISCNPVTQAENVKELIKAGYHLHALQPVDQFPHTVHIENIVLLTKR